MATTAGSPTIAIKACLESLSAIAFPLGWYGVVGIRL